MFRLIPNWLIVFILLLLASVIAERAKAARPMPPEMSQTNATTGGDCWMG